jgi:hypothetical protein
MSQRRHASGGVLRFNYVFATSKHSYTLGV